jgi:hypothetical protein
VDKFVRVRGPFHAKCAWRHPFWCAYPNGKFVALVYYPFPTQYVNVQSRLHCTHLDALFFAGETKSSIDNSVEMMLGKRGLRKIEH